MITVCLTPHFSDWRSSQHQRVCAVLQTYISVGSKYTGKLSSLGTTSVLKGNHHHFRSYLPLYLINLAPTLWIPLCVRCSKNPCGHQDALISLLPIEDLLRHRARQWGSHGIWSLPPWCLLVCREILFKSIHTCNMASIIGVMEDRPTGL